ncbi:MAG: Septin-domain-containing protein [Olpidium bornovanus]|uniref:Septin-domain-containing protein n=1 Tax=Olpidium bornovanus TaxID=278681 RepID=A0A8H8A125_9FUNG|nr:MAG: Septin-domain-containing protein [Olpidium bornovanus]
MIVGESGLGKSTLVNCLFNSQLYPPEEDVPQFEEPQATLTIRAIPAEIVEGNVKLRLTVIDTPGFGDFVNLEDSWKPIQENIESRFDAYLEQENRVNRSNIVDDRVHACIYFISPTGHALKPIDVEFMSRMHTRVNLIPVIAKADTLTDSEIKAYKERILEEIAFHNIRIFSPVTNEFDDPETLAENKDIMVLRVSLARLWDVLKATNEFPPHPPPPYPSSLHVPANDIDKEVENPATGRVVRGRKYPWGVIEVDNEDHCDFVKLRSMLVRTHMEELKEYTKETLYENYRTEKLEALGISGWDVSKNVNQNSRMEEERAAHDAKMAKMEAEMKMVFQQKVQEKEAKLKQSEEELYARHKEMKEALERQRADLEEKKRRLEGGGRPATPEKQKKKGFGPVRGAVMETDLARDSLRIMVVAVAAPVSTKRMSAVMASVATVRKAISRRSRTRARSATVDMMVRMLSHALEPPPQCAKQSFQLSCVLQHAERSGPVRAAGAGLKESKKSNDERDVRVAMATQEQGANEGAILGGVEGFLSGDVLVLVECTGGLGRAGFRRTSDREQCEFRRKDGLAELRQAKPRPSAPF